MSADEQLDKRVGGAPTDTARQKPPKVKRRGRYTNSSGFKTDLAILRAQGMSQRQVGRQLGVDQSTVARVEKLPEVQARITELRQQWKNAAHTRLNAVACAAWDMVQTAVENRDAKAFDAATRGIYAMEKISVSVADVPQKVDVSGIPAPQNSKAEIKALLLKLFPDSSGPPEAQRDPG